MWNYVATTKTIKKLKHVKGLFFALDILKYLSLKCKHIIGNRVKLGFSLM